MEETLREVAARTDAAIAAARVDLVFAVRGAIAAGMTQVEVAEQIGRSQPEVSRLLRFHGRSPLAMNLRRNSKSVKEMVAAVGGSNVRVFGSIAQETDTENSDVDLLVSLAAPLSLLELSALERHLEELLGVSVDVIPEDSLRPDIRERILQEAVPL